MGKGVTPARFKKEFCARVRLARLAARYEPEQVAEIIGVPVDTWRRYELRTLLPHHMIPRVAALFGVDVEFFYMQENIGKEVRRA
jgi:transcriptional regulator with XRE-family HTH domain